MPFILGKSVFYHNLFNKFHLVSLLTTVMTVILVE